MSTPLKGTFGFPVHEIVRRPGEMRTHHVDVVIKEAWGEGLVAIPSGEKVNLDIRLESVHEGILVTGDAHAVYRGECGRCLDPVSDGVEVEFQELFAYARDEANDFEVQDDHVDLENLVRDAIVLALPFQPVCREDCPGLDSVTGNRLSGQNLNSGTDEYDSRWSALRSMLDPDSAQDA